jgi:hypothetical protein
MKSISFGGLGDCINVFCKLNEMNWPVDHLFIESNSRTLELIEEFKRNSLHCPQIVCSYEKDENYYNNFLSGKWADRRPINTSWNGEYKFPHQDKIVCKEKLPILHSTRKEKVIVVQMYAGVNESRHWKFPLTALKQILLKSFPKHHVAFISSLSLFTDNISLAMKSDLFIGLSGFHNYLCTNQGLKNIMLEESEQHTKHYIREEDRQSNYLKIIKNGSMQEILFAAKELLND